MKTLEEIGQHPLMSHQETAMRPKIRGKALRKAAPTPNRKRLCSKEYIKVKDLVSLLGKPPPNSMDPVGMFICVIIVLNAMSRRLC